jgi:hypothetical protein
LKECELQNSEQDWIGGEIDWKKKAMGFVFEARKETTSIEKEK